MKTALKKIFDLLAFLLGIRSDARDQAVDDGICDYSGQGRDKYGR